MAGPIRIAVLANARQAKSELNGVAGTAEKTGRRFAKLRAPAGAALLAVAVGAKRAIDKASDLSEEVSKSSVIFGKQAGSIQKWAGTADTSLGQSKRAALQAAGGFGLIAQKAGLGGKETAAFAKQFTGLSSDLASFNNTTPEEAVVALSAAMRGESEPIRKYGVLLDDATLRARALKMGLIKTTKDALTPQNKALAASEEIMAQTKKAQGDFARTADGAANKQRILAAQSENLQAKLGKGLLPAYEALLRVGSKLAGYLSENPKLVSRGAIAIVALSAVVLAASVAQKIYTAGLVIYKGVAFAVKAATIAWRNAQFALNIALALNPIGVVVLAVVALIAIFILAYKRSEKFRAIVSRALAGVKKATTKAINATVGFIKSNWKKVPLLLLGPLLVAVLLVKRNWGKIKDATRAAVAYVRERVSSAWGYVRERTRAAWQGIVDTIRGRIDAAMSWVRGIKGRVTGVFAAAGTWLLGAGKSILAGLLGGMKDAWEDAAEWLSGLAGKIPKIKGPPAKDRRLLRSNGRLILQGLREGFEDQFPAVERTLGTLTKRIAGYAPALSLAGLAGGLDASAVLSSTSSSTIHLTMTLSAEQLSSLERGRKISADLDAFKGSGGRRKAK